MESGSKTKRDVGSSATSAPVNRPQTYQSDGRNGGESGGVGDTASMAVRHVSETASSLARTANNKVQEVLDQQVGKGAEIIENIAGSIRAAAGDLDQSSPQLAELVRAGADRMDEFSQTVRGSSATDLFREGGDFARRQPAIVFGAMTLLGFGLYRLFSTKPEREAGTHFHGGGETETVFEPDDGAATSTLRVYRPEGVDGL